MSYAFDLWLILGEQVLGNHEGRGPGVAVQNPKVCRLLGNSQAHQSCFAQSQTGSPASCALVAKGKSCVCACSYMHTLHDNLIPLYGCMYRHVCNQSTRNQHIFKFAFFCDGIPLDSLQLSHGTSSTCSWSTFGPGMCRPIHYHHPLVYFQTWSLMMERHMMIARTVGPM